MILEIHPTSFPSPEASKPYDVFVTTWVNAIPPADWHFGDPVPT